MGRSTIKRDSQKQQVVLTRFASKGVVSLILPSELRPYIQSTGERIDFIYSPFGVFSRMNLSQVLELTCAKSTHRIDQLIKNDPNNISNYLLELNETVLKYVGNNKYYNDVNQLISLIKTNNSVKNDVINDIVSSNLFIEVPSFTKVDIRNLLKNITPKANENVVIPLKTINYLREKMDCFKDLIINEDVVIPNAFCGMMYIQKLNKISEKLITYRDLGPLKYGTMQPERGRAAGGGSTLGQMEIESIIASGCENALTELLTVKNDWSSEKKKLLNSLITTGKYNLPNFIPEDSSRTKVIVNSILKFLKD